MAGNDHFIVKQLKEKHVLRKWDEPKLARLNNIIQNSPSIKPDRLFNDLEAKLISSGHSLTERILLDVTKTLNVVAPRSSEGEVKEFAAATRRIPQFMQEYMNRSIKFSTFVESNATLPLNYATGPVFLDLISQPAPTSYYRNVRRTCVDRMQSFMKRNLSHVEIANFMEQCEETIVNVGQVFWNPEKENKIYLTDGHSNAELDLTRVEKYSLFSGQIVGVGGKSNGNTFYAEEIIYGQQPPAYPIKDKNGALTVISASGPFTTEDSLSFQPLIDLLDYIAMHPCHVLILTGPFLPEYYDAFSDDLERMDGSFNDRTYTGIFNELRGMIAQKTEGRVGKVVIAPSQDEIFHIHPMPQPPYDTPFDHVEFVSNPSIFSVNGITISLIACDIVKELIQRTKTVKGGLGNNKIQLAFASLLGQGHFLPAFESGPHDPSHESFFEFDNSPDVFITTNPLTPLAMPVGQTLCVNNRSLCNATNAGNFVELHIAAGTGDFTSRVRSKIINI